VSASLHRRQEVGLASPRTVHGKRFLPLVEYTVYSFPLAAEVITFGVVQPCGIVVVWKELDRLKAGILPTSGLLVPENISWNEILEKALARMTSQG